MDQVPIPMNSRLRSRSFTFGENINRIQPNSALVQFLESPDPVDISVIADRTIEMTKRNTPTGQQGLTLPIPGFTFNLTEQGYYDLPMSLSHFGLCHEVQLEFSGTGNWSLYQIKMTAYEAAPIPAYDSASSEFHSVIQALKPLLRTHKPLCVMQTDEMLDWCSWYWNRGTMTYVIDDNGPQGVCLIKLFRIFRNLWITISMILAANS